MRIASMVMTGALVLAPAVTAHADGWGQCKTRDDTHGGCSAGDAGSVGGALAVLALAIGRRRGKEGPCE
jgi:MYXO-CTERM domain-containing protein